MKADMNGTLQTLSRFLNIDVDEEKLRFVTEKSSFQYMLSHSEKFNDHFVYRSCKDRMGLPKSSMSPGVAKVRKGGGKVGTRKQLPKSVQIALNERWKSVLEAQTGHKCYEDFRNALCGARMD